MRCFLWGTYWILIRNVTDLFKAFLGNGTVNAFQRATTEDVFQL
jgi:hypothetical protein